MVFYTYASAPYPRGSTNRGNSHRTMRAGRISVPQGTESCRQHEAEPGVKNRRTVLVFALFFFVMPVDARS